MPFVAINSADIEVGDPITADLFTQIKDDLDNHESRVNSLETTTPKINVFKFLLLNGSSFSTAAGVTYYRSEDDFTITKAAIQIFEKNSLTGFVEIDIKKSTTNMDNASFSSIFTTKPKITYSTAADYAETTNQVLASPASTIAVGNYLRLDITITPTNTGVIPKLFITCYGE